jgi:hypothetical protein
MKYEVVPTGNKGINIFANYVTGNEIFVDENDWYDIVDNYSQEFIIKQLSDAIELFEISLPYRNILLGDVQNEYEALLNKEDLLCEGKWINKFEYLYPYIDKYIGISNVGNAASDYFHQEERWKCDATGYPSPAKTWENERFRLTLFKALFSLKVKEINPQVFRNIISLRKYIAAQFRPSAAKAIYDYFQAETVLDFSMGWGDRILGAHASKYVKKYIGIDPNINLLNGYSKQIKYYNSIGTPMEFSLYPECAEDPTLYIPDKVDLVFTSPPYFDKEKYDQSEKQSYVKYKAFDSWMNDFLCKAIELRTQNLKKGGHLVINISDIYTRHKLFKICDRMNDYIGSTNKFTYIGAIGLRMPKRPMSISSDTVGVFAEPIWIWKKK